MLFHVSPHGGLKTLRPRVSSHGAAYVYAIDSLVTGLLFGAPKDDFDLMMDVDAAGRPEVWECWPGAFEHVYRGKSCYVYTVAEEGFRRGVTGWAPELVCRREVPVLSETPVPDLLGRLLAAEAGGGGELVLHRYETAPAYRAMVAEHVVDRLVRFGLDPARLIGTDRRFQTHFRPLAEGLLALTDGHLL